MRGVVWASRGRVGRGPGVMAEAALDAVRRELRGFPAAARGELRVRHSWHGRGGASRAGVPGAPRPAGPVPSQAPQARFSLPALPVASLSATLSASPRETRLGFGNGGSGAQRARGRARPVGPPGAPNTPSRQWAGLSELCRPHLPLWDGAPRHTFASACRLLDLGSIPRHLGSDF